jgi:hypothetical protein
MSIILRIFLMTVFALAMPVLGFVSWLFVQEGNWLVSYAAAGMSWASPLIVVKIMEV